LTQGFAAAARGAWFHFETGRDRMMWPKAINWAASGRDWTWPRLRAAFRVEPVTFGLGASGAVMASAVS
jgi:hypothetical protein